MASSGMPLFGQRRDTDKESVMKWLVAFFWFSTLADFAAGQDWPSFRGPSGNGSTEHAGTPLRWSATEGVKWTAPLPMGGNGSPIVVGKRVFVTSAEDGAGLTRTLFCFDAESGKPIWNRPVRFDRTMPTHKTNPYGGTTPASDGRHVVVWHGSAGLFAYDMEGNELWSRDLGEYRHMWGYGTSPVIFDDRVILHTGPGEEVFVVALDLRTGEELWRHQEPLEGTGERNAAGQYMGSWATPVLIERDRRSIAVCAMATRVCGLDVRSGQIVWYCEGLAGDRGDLAYSSPMIEGDVCVMIGGFQGPALGFEIAGSGDLTPAHRLWRKVGNPQNIGTGLMIGGHVYRVNAGPNLIDCLDARTGEVVWQQRAEGNAFWGSVAYDGEHAYATDQSGTTVVFKPTTEGPNVVALNPLEDTCNATPALASQRVFIRTYSRLWCIDGK